MAFVKVLSLAALPAESAKEVVVKGVPVALCHAAGEVHAIGGVCPHQGGPLGYGAINGESITCPWHAWDFNCATGVMEFNADYRVATYPVRIEDGDILVDVDPVSEHA